jgi:flagellar hook-basal body complex protein FliE
MTMSGITDRLDINTVLQQMRDLKSQVQMPAPGGAASAQGLEGIGKSDRPGFSDLLQQAVNSVNETQLRAGEMQRAYELGDEGVDITQVMIQMQKASVSFEAMTQVRNRLISAYQDIMNMPI